MFHALVSMQPEKQANTELHLSPQLPMLNERFRLALESTSRLAFDWHIPDDRLVFCGTPGESLQGAIPDTTKIWGSDSLFAIIHEADRDGFRERLHDALKGICNDGTLYNAEVRLRDTKQSWRWVEICGKIVERADNGLAIRMTGTLSDIDGRKRTENRASRLQALHVASRYINQAIVRHNDRDKLFADICRFAVEYARFDLAWIGLVGPYKKYVLPAALYGKYQGPAGTLATTLDKPSAAGDGTPGTALKEYHTTTCGDHHLIFDSEYADEAARTGSRSASSFPIRRSGRLIGVITLYAPDADFFDEEAVDLIEEITRDVSFALETYERKSQRDAQQSELAYRESVKSAILTAAPDCIVSLDRNGTIISFNYATEITFGYCSADMLGKDMTDVLVAPEWRKMLRADVDSFFSAGESRALGRRVELAAMRADGSTFPVELTIVPLEMRSGPALTAFIRDISERKRAETLQTGQNRILNLIATGAALRDILTEIVQFAERHTEQSICSIFQLNSDGTRLSNWVAPSLPASFASGFDESKVNAYRATRLPGIARDHLSRPTNAGNEFSLAAPRMLALKYGLKTCRSWQILGKTREKLGILSLYSHEGSTPPADEQQLVEICTRLAGIAIESRISEEKIRRLAHYDGLTSLPNRFLFKEYLDLALRSARRSGKKFAVLFVDLDKFKEINDTLGHDAGDRVLQEIAMRMRDCLRHTDKIARMGGDEFYALIEELNDSRHVADIAQKLLEEVARPVYVGGNAYELSASIGIAIYPDDGKNGEALLRNADTAMYRVKHLGKNGHQFFSGATADDSGASLFNQTYAFGYHGEKSLELN